MTKLRIAHMSRAIAPDTARVLCPNIKVPCMERGGLNKSPHLQATHRMKQMLGESTGRGFVLLLCDHSTHLQLGSVVFKLLKMYQGCRERNNMSCSAGEIMIRRGQRKKLQQTARNYLICVQLILLTCE